MVGIPRRNAGATLEKQRQVIRVGPSVNQRDNGVCLIPHRTGLLLGDVTAVGRRNLVEHDRVGPDLGEKVANFTHLPRHPPTSVRWVLLDPHDRQVGKHDNERVQLDTCSPGRSSRVCDPVLNRTVDAPERWTHINA